MLSAQNTELLVFLLQADLPHLEAIEEGKTWMNLLGSGTAHVI